MTSRENEPVTVKPVRVLGVIPHDLIVENVSHGSTSHGKTGMTRLGLLHRIDRQEPDRVNRFVDNRRIGARLEGLDSRGADEGADRSEFGHRRGVAAARGRGGA